MDDFSSPEEMALAASVSGFIVSDGSEDTVSSRCTSAEGKTVHPVLSKFQPNLPLCTPPSGVRFLWYSHWRQSSKQPVSCSLGFPPLYDSRFAHIGEHFHCGRIVMIKEQTLSFIQSADGLHRSQIHPGSVPSALCEWILGSRLYRTGSETAGQSVQPFFRTFRQFQLVQGW